MKVLSIDGGGYLGLATASFMEETERHFGKRFHEHFDLFCGTSTGAIIALAVAAGLSGREVRELYEDFGPRIFKNSFPGHRELRSLWGLFSSRYGNGALKESLERVFAGRRLGDLLASGKRVVIPSFCLTTGKPRIFKTDHGPDLTKHGKYTLSSVALASASAPVYLPIVAIDDPETGAQEEFCDGGVYANHPALLGFSEATYHCAASPGSIRLLSISTPRASLAEHASAKSLIGRSLNRGTVAWAWDGKLASIFVDASSLITHETLRRLVEKTPGALYERVALSKPEGIDMDIATPEATLTLKNLGTNEASQNPMRDRLRPFFGA